MRYGPRNVRVLLLPLFFVNKTFKFFVGHAQNADEIKKFLLVS